MVLFTKMELNPYSAAEEGETFYSTEELFCSYEWTAQLGVDAVGPQRRVARPASRQGRYR